MHRLGQEANENLCYKHATLLLISSSFPGVAERDSWKKRRIGKC